MRHAPLHLETLLAAAWFLLGWPQGVLAQDGTPPPGTVCDPLLAPVAGAEHVRLEAVTLRVVLFCEGDSCRLRSHHTYRLRNTLRAQGASAQVGLAVDGDCQIAPDAPLRSADADVPRVAGTAEYPSIWQVELPPGSSVQLALEYDRDLGAAHVLDWRWRSSSLGAWGEVESAHVELSLPMLTADESLLVIQPTGSSFDGYYLVWTHEALSGVPDHSVTLLAPPLAERLDALRSAGGGAEYARLMLAARTEVAARGLPTVAWDAEIAASLLATLAAHPDDLDARMDLAELYRQQASNAPDGRLNHLLLALEELEECRRLSGDADAVRTALARCYYEAALAASDEGDPAAAMGYLEQAEGLGGAQRIPELGQSETLFLRWALSMANQGQVREAFERVSDRLSAETLDTLLHYAPPITEVRMAVLLQPGGRRVTWVFRLYPPTAQDGLARLLTLAQSLQTVSGCEALMTEGDGAVTLTLNERYASPAERDTLHTRVREVLSGSGDLLAAVIGAPYAGQVIEYGISHRPFRDILMYQEWADMTDVARVWAWNERWNCAQQGARF